MTADLSASTAANRAADIRLTPLSPAVAEAKDFLAKGIGLAKKQAFEPAIAHFTTAIKAAFTLLQNLPTPNPLALSEQPTSHAEIAAIEITLTQSFYHRGCALCRVNKYDRAIADFTHLIHQPPTSSAIPADWLITKLTEIYIHRGNAYRRLGEYVHALSDLNQGVSRSGGTAQSYSARGLLRLDMDEFAGAIADFTQALALHPTFAQGYLWRGFAYLRSDRPDLAITDLTHAIAAIPTCAEAYNHRGVAHVRQHHLIAARQDFDQAIRLQSDFAEAYSNRGNVLLLLGEPARAAVDYDQAIALAPHLAELYFNRTAATHSGDGYPDKTQASIDYDTTDLLPVSSAAFYRHRAQVRAHEGKLSAAIADYTQAIALTPTAHAFYQRGLLSQALGQSEQALADLDQAIERSPDYGKAYCDRAQLRFQLNDFTGALADIEQALIRLSHPPKSAYVTCCLSHFSLGDHSRAIEAFEQLIAHFQPDQSQLGQSQLEHFQSGHLQSGYQSSSQTSKDSTSIGSAGG